MTGAPKPGGNRPGVAELDRQLTKLVLEVAMMRPAQQFAVPNQISRNLQERHAMRIATFRVKRSVKNRAGYSPPYSWKCTAFTRLRGLSTSMPRRIALK